MCVCEITALRRRIVVRIGACTTLSLADLSRCEYHDSWLNANQHAVWALNCSRIRTRNVLGIVPICTTVLCKQEGLGNNKEPRANVRYAE